ncbi:MAG: nucleoside triphosphate pyrophosphohydrolase [Bacteroidia bacterium]|nr:nucleoside triphosphate pyrophosphohydrolase [Bacteroidota bacterium]MBK7387975.1 nucleoside triphosphate pyrophosphohydrolase [Bacteroidota bacterium]MBK8876734.1 nucleoside triphosphate pyrophosphohydrolase [Bacteroidota bacterium]MBK9424927.1 nucleoside triphosphate pyrophosphohydrolase [Bacteroidota bacterium]MBP9083243.1 nucleoside triphosphate pyrophosphohydrolase [Bacteroidia bacterium]
MESVLLSKTNSMDARLIAFERLLNIMDDLRAKCPWDKVQTMETLRHLTIEEVYELGDAILAGDKEEVRKELGDILLHIVFYAKIGSESNDFDITSVINQVCDKLIHRHPHIYSDVKVDNADDVSRNWEQLKLKEGKKSVLEGVPTSLPSLVKAMRIQEKARSAGFDWEEKLQVLDKVEEELKELRVELAAGNSSKIEGEFGDLLFSLVNLSRFIDVNPDEALERTNRKFVARFKYLENAVSEQGKKLTDMSLSEMDTFWNEAKAKGL